MTGFVFVFYYHILECHFSNAKAFLQSNYKSGTLSFSGILRVKLLPVWSKLPKEVMWVFKREIVCRTASFLCSKCGWNHRGSKGVIYCHCGHSNIQSASVALTLLDNCRKANIWTQTLFIQTFINFHRATKTADTATSS